MERICNLLSYRAWLLQAGKQRQATQRNVLPDLTSRRCLPPTSAPAPARSHHLFAPPLRSSLPTDARVLNLLEREHDLPDLLPSTPVCEYTYTHRQRPRGVLPPCLVATLQASASASTMFSTFTGNSRRPRNVNLSGQAGNPFTNTSWSPSAASSANKTVSNAQADRERRQAERQRLKAAGKIQRTWRGHRERSRLAEFRRDEFDHLYVSGSHYQAAARLPLAFNLLLAFFTPRRHDDIRRLLLFARDSQTVDVVEIPPAGTHPSRISRLVHILVQGLNSLVTQALVHPVEEYTDTTRTHADICHDYYRPEENRESRELFEIVARIISTHPSTLSVAADGYYSALAGVTRHQSHDETSTAWLADIFAVPILSASAPGMYLFGSQTNPWFDKLTNGRP